MAKATIQSVEPNIADLANGWLKSYGLDYKLEQESLNTAIDQALNDYASKNGGVGGNRPDAKLLLRDKNLVDYPILIEYKGYKDKLIKLNDDGKVANKTAKNTPDFKNINSYAVNGAVHYANAIMHYTSYTDIIAIGMTGYKDERGILQHKISVYFVSKSNFGIGQEVGEYSDFSFLKKENFDEFIEKVKRLQLTQEEIDKLKEQREREIDASLVKLNNDIYQNEKGLGENDRVYLVAASIIATIGIPNKVPILDKSDLKSSTEDGNRDGDIILRKIKGFLKEKKIPQTKKDLIVRTLENTLTNENINKVENGESQLKRVFTKIVDDLGIYYKIGLTTDFTGKLFNEMYNWLGFSQDKLNDVVLTPSYIATLLAKLARIDKDSYVWDFATGSAGLLVASMNEMLIDAKNKIKSPDEFAKKSAAIKANQLLGLEILPSVYMLAILNMILMGDGSSNILNKDSLKDFDGNYGFGDTDKKFPATAFVLNPPYSSEGKGMIFVERALSMMNKGYAAIIIQNSAGSGKAIEYNKKILKHNTLLASIKMPEDLFIGKSSVHPNIYVFRVGETHQKDDTVKFIDFSNDGYTRTNRKKASCNLRDTDRAKERYQEIVDLVRFGKSKLNIFTENEYYEGNIDPENGADWNQVAPIDTKPTLEDFKKTVSDYLSWEVSSVLKGYNQEDDSLGGISTKLNEKLQSVKWGEYELEELFTSSNGDFDIQKTHINGCGDYVITAGLTNNGILGKTDITAKVFETKTITVDMFGFAFYRNFNYKMVTHARVFSLKPKFVISDRQGLFLANALCFLNKKFGYENMCSWEKIKNDKIQLPTKDGQIDFDFMEDFINELEVRHIIMLEAYLSDTK
ncbi:MAG: N-6 DNA methylase [Clostridia bacterium]|nr:N-6 DNA methylase [Clostridia bacterium]